ncbi:MAG TPA: hypothetical protein PK914_05765 [Smithellaceae bacterium]|nr:MAG: Phage late control gene D protein (GPD) [Deltaproteobacteria bacterium ADurb.BinA014]HOZ61615.1 hypothetical protein [Smithellaceae bacterium]
MSDKVSLHIGGQRIENFLAYSIAADIYTADDVFALELANPEVAIEPGKKCELYINEQRELTGIIDRVDHSYDKKTESLRVEGRDLCGLLVDSYAEDFFDEENMSVKALAERLLRRVPFINRKDIIYQENIRGRSKSKGMSAVGIFDTDHAHAKPDPGRTIFDILKTYSARRGMMFYALENGTLVFGKPKSGGAPLYHLINRRAEPQNNNVLKGSFVRDISRRYSKILVIGQQQDIDEAASDVNVTASVEDPIFPFYKPYVLVDNNDEISPKLAAQMLLEKMKWEGYQLEYRVTGHSQNGINYRINEMCNVEDEVFGVRENLLIYRRTFELSKKDGVTTILGLGLPGVVQ